MLKMEPLLAFMNKWISPFTITAALGFVIWLVQLEARTVDQQAVLAKMLVTMEDIQDDIQSTALLVSRTNAIQVQLIHQLDSLEVRMTRNENWISENRHDHNERP